jgi:aminoglycoside 3'-phosphotransferase-2
LNCDDDLGFVRSLFRREGWTDLSSAHVALLDHGMSDASVYRLSEDGRPPRFLKTARGAAAQRLREEIARTRWLAHHGIDVPDVMRVHEERGHTALLMAAVPGVAADAGGLPPLFVAEALARGFKALHALDGADCPFDETPATRLARAAEAVAAGEVDPDAFEPRNQAMPPETLLARLQAERPAEDIVVVHGDATLANLFVAADGAIGFIDCGNAGRGDRYTDLAVLAADIDEHYGFEARDRFVRAYGLPWDAAKARYFADLYEFF